VKVHWFEAQQVKQHDVAGLSIIERVVIISNRKLGIVITARERCSGQQNLERFTQ